MYVCMYVCMYAPANNTGTIAATGTINSTPPHWLIPLVPDDFTGTNYGGQPRHYTETATVRMADFACGVKSRRTWCLSSKVPLGSLHTEYSTRKKQAEHLSLS